MSGGLGNTARWADYNRASAAGEGYVEHLQGIKKTDTIQERLKKMGLVAAS